MEIEDQLLSCLAGNAFSSTCATIAILALLVLLGACALEQDEDDDDDDDLGKNADGDWIYARYTAFSLFFISFPYFVLFFYIFLHFSLKKYRF